MLICTIQFIGIMKQLQIILPKHLNENKILPKKINLVSLYYYTRVHYTLLWYDKEHCRKW